MYLTTCITYFSVTLLSSEPEVQYVALRNINLIVQKRYIVQFRYWCMCVVRFCRHVVQTNLKIISVLISTINKWFSLYLLLLSGSFCCLSCHLWPECQANLPFPLLFWTSFVFNTVVLFFSPQGWHPQEWDESVLCQVQWSNLRQAWEAGYHDSTGKSTEHCTSIGRIERVRSCYINMGWSLTKHEVLVQSR